MYVLVYRVHCMIFYFFFFQAEDGIRDLVRSRGLGDVYKRQDDDHPPAARSHAASGSPWPGQIRSQLPSPAGTRGCLLYTSDAADERSSVDLGGRRIIKKKKEQHSTGSWQSRHTDLLEWS